MTPLWRQPFDAIERPITAISESWVQSNLFMDLTAAAFRLERRLTGDMHHLGERWLHAWGLQSRGDTVRVQNQIAGLEREVRQLKREVGRREEASQTRDASQRRAA
jgi:hypothetical protein